MWANKSGVRGNPTPAAVDKKAMRTHHRRAKLDFLHIPGCAFKAAADRFQNSTGLESKAGIPYSRSIIGSRKSYAWCQKADEVAIAHDAKQADPNTAEGPRLMKPDDRMKAFGHKSDIRIGQDSWAFLFTGLNFKFSKEYQDQKNHLREGKRIEKQQKIVDTVPRNEVEPPAIRESRTSQILEAEIFEDAHNAMFAEEDLHAANHPIGFRTLPESMTKQAMLQENARLKENSRKARLVANPDQWSSDDENYWKFDAHDKDCTSSEQGSECSQQSAYAKDKTS